MYLSQDVRPHANTKYFIILRKEKIFKHRNLPKQSSARVHECKDNKI